MSTTWAAPPVADGLLSIDPAALLAGRCRDCAALHFPRRGLCPECQSEAIESHALSGTGSLYTFTIVRIAPPGYLGETPYAVGVVELPDGLRVSSTIIASELEALRIGDEVEFTLLTLGSGTEQVLSYAFARAPAP